MIAPSWRAVIGVAWAIAFLVAVVGLLRALVRNRQHNGYLDPVIESQIKQRQADMQRVRRERQRP